MSVDLTSDGAEGQIFGVPAVLTQAERSSILDTLVRLWELTYGDAPSGISVDFDKASYFFDPTARGFKLRERLADLPIAPAELANSAKRIGVPVVVDAGDGRYLVGVEARILIWLLSEDLPASARDTHIVMSQRVLLEAQSRALAVYRDWSVQRLQQVIDLRSGRGAEVMQAVAVGVVLALLVNRSTREDRAVVLLENPEERDQVNTAIFSAAGRFAETVGRGRGRSASEQKLEGGYGITEARRRLAHRLVLQPRGRDHKSLIFIPESSQDEVIDLLGSDLARRSALSQPKLDLGFDELVTAFRSESRRLANRSMIFERATDTDRLKEKLLSAFCRAREKNPKPGR